MRVKLNDPRCGHTLREVDAEEFLRDDFGQLVRDRDNPGQFKTKKVKRMEPMPWAQQKGDIVEVDEADGRRMIAVGQATLAGDDESLSPAIDHRERLASMGR